MTTTVIILVMRCRPGVPPRAIAEADEMQQIEDEIAAAHLDPKVPDRARDAPRPPLPSSPTNPAGCSRSPPTHPGRRCSPSSSQGGPGQAAAASDLGTPEEVRRRRATGPSPGDVAGGGGGRGGARRTRGGWVVAAWCGPAAAARGREGKERSECRCLKRSDLVETLAKHLPGGSIRFGCQVEAISLDAVTRCPIVSTSDGSTIRAKVVIVCDGANSVVAKFLGLKPPRSLPMWAARAMTTIPEGHSFRDRFLNLVSDGISFRLVPMDHKTVYFAAIQCRPPKEHTNMRDPALIRQAALQAMQGYPEDVLDVVRSCDVSSMSLTQICYRPPWHLVFQPFQEGTVTVAGDAMHAMGPFIGQGGSSSLEDAIVIARSLAQTASDDGAKGIEKAVMSYVKERRVRILRLSVQAFLNGQLVVATSKPVKVLIRAALAVLFTGNSDRHSDFDCGSL